MFRVIALGYRAGMIVDRLRAKKNFDDIRFVYCNTDSRLLKACGKEEDEHILLTDIAQCRKDIHDDNELMAVLVTCMFGDVVGNDSWKYSSEIMAELWNYADHTYCITSLPFWAGRQRPAAIEMFKKITYWSDITVLQDDLKDPYIFTCLNLYCGMVRFLDLLLSHPQKGRSSELGDLPFGVWATVKQLLTALNAMYSNNMPKYYEAGTFSFHKSTHE